MAIAALLTHIEIQYPQATRKAAKSPKPAFEYTYGPPLLLGTSTLSLLKTRARSKAPAAEKQPSNYANTAVGS